MERESLAQRVRQWVVGTRRPTLVGAAGPLTVGPLATGPLGYLTPALRALAPRPSTEGAGSPAEKRAYLARVKAAAELVEHGRPLCAIVLSRETSERRFNGAQIIIVELEIEDPLATESPRTMVYEHIFGPATARSWKPGREIQIWIDPRDPDRIYAGR
ncbi:MAG: hypothetical protein M3N46_01270 [Actinomycetota bacterium]|nr:hypothetical protein [Actinomycetota bacterium]